MKRLAPSERPSTQSAPRVPMVRASVKRPYAKPRVEPAGSVFNRTRALAGGGKDIINGSGIL